MKNNIKINFDRSSCKLSINMYRWKQLLAFSYYCFIYYFKIFANILFPRHQVEKMFCFKQIHSVITLFYLSAIWHHSCEDSHNNWTKLLSLRFPGKIIWTGKNKSRIETTRRQIVVLFTLRSVSKRINMSVDEREKVSLVN